MCATAFDRKRNKIPPDFVKTLINDGVINPLASYSKLDTSGAGSRSTVRDLRHFLSNVTVTRSMSSCTRYSAIR